MTSKLIVSPVARIRLPTTKLARVDPIDVTTTVTTVRIFVRRLANRPLGNSMSVSSSRAVALPPRTAITAEFGS